MFKDKKARLAIEKLRYILGITQDNSFYESSIVKEVERLHKKMELLFDFLDVRYEKTCPQERLVKKDTKHDNKKV